MIKLDIYREIRANEVRPDMLVSPLADDGTPEAPVVVCSVTIAREGKIRMQADGRADALILDWNDQLRLHPTGPDLDKVWLGLTDAIRAAVADWVERHDGEDDVSEAPPWEILDSAGTRLSVNGGYVRYRVDRLTDPPSPEA
jgi:hypothetical protein